jgi:hypothetical protein
MFRREVSGIFVRAGMVAVDQQRVLFGNIYSNPVVVEFSEPAQSSDGGAILLREVDEQTGLCQAIRFALRERRQLGKIDHPLLEMLRQRVIGIACGYPDCNDAGHLADDPIMKLSCGLAPNGNDKLASQPTLSRLENSITRSDLVRMSYAMTDAVIEAHRRRRPASQVTGITIDLDPVEDPTYGSQQLTFFNAFYDNWCYLPMVASIQFGKEKEQFGVATMLRPGNASGDVGAIAMLKRLVPRLRKAFPSAKLRVRMDGAFATAPLLAWCEKAGLTYFVNLAKNPKLTAKAEALMKRSRKEARRLGRTSKILGEFRHKASTWKAPRRVIVKAEVTVLEGRSPRDNPRFVVTNDRRLSPKKVYETYAQRGDVENRYKELKHGLDFDRTSCTKAEANRFRYILATAAFILFQHLRRSVPHPDLARAQVPTLRERLVKLAVVVVESARRVLLKAPRAFAWIGPWRQAALAATHLRL